ncbi:MAG: hypothetical protein II947_07740 [Bacteroidaceae bacterium]|nr:hypothetical protein [Bacteroidaceae bacterium]
MTIRLSGSPCFLESTRTVAHDGSMDSFFCTVSPSNVLNLQLSESQSFLRMY